ncbi:MAG: nitrophenyl compound nitroreductase subunit ArsF family protein [bacterium]
MQRRILQLKGTPMVARAFSARIIIFMLAATFAFQATAVDLRARSHPDEGIAQSHQVKLLYFHRRFRCPECEKIEAGTRKALETHFPDAMADGRLVMSIIDLDEPGNEHYTKDYNFFFNTIIVVNVKNGQDAGYKNLEDVWKIYEDEEALSRYIRTAVGDYLID